MATTTTTLPATAQARRPALKSRPFITAVLAVLLAATPVFAINAGDVLDKMKDDERNAYFEGAIEMAMYLAAAQDKNPAKSECILNWYFNSKGKTAREIVGVFDQYKDKPAAALLTVLINRHCGSK